jgi:hypothetical protein
LVLSRRRPPRDLELELLGNIGSEGVCILTESRLTFYVIRAQDIATVCGYLPFD